MAGLRPCRPRHGRRSPGLSAGRFAADGRSPEHGAFARTARAVLRSASAHAGLPDSALGASRGRNAQEPDAARAPPRAAGGDSVPPEIRLSGAARALAPDRSSGDDHGPARAGHRDAARLCEARLCDVAADRASSRPPEFRRPDLCAAGAGAVASATGGAPMNKRLLELLRCPICRSTVTTEPPRPGSLADGT